MLVKKIFLISFRVQFADIKKPTTSQLLFKDFVCLLGTTFLRNNSFVLTGPDHIHSMRDFQSSPICSQFDYTFDDLFGKTIKIVYKNILLKECIRGYLLHGSIFCVGIYMSVSKPSICFWKRVISSGRTSCLFTISIWQVKERVHVVNGSYT